MITDPTPLIAQTIVRDLGYDIKILPRVLVEIIGVKTKPELNGSVGVCEHAGTPVDRFNVRMEDGRLFNWKRDNLTVAFCKEPFAEQLSTKDTTSGIKRYLMSHKAELRTLAQGKHAYPGRRAGAKLLKQHRKTIDNTMR